MTGKTRLEQVIMSASKGIAVGVQFNDSRIASLVERLEQQMIHAVNDAADIDHLLRLQDSIRYGYNRFAAENSFVDCIFFPVRQRFDILIYFPSRELAQKYIDCVRAEFPDYRFFLAVKPEENVLSNVRKIL